MIHVERAEVCAIREGRPHQKADPLRAVLQKPALELNSGNASSKEPIDPNLLGDLDSLYRQVNRDLPAIAGRSFPWWPEG